MSKPKPNLKRCQEIALALFNLEVSYKPPEYWELTDESINAVIEVFLEYSATIQEFDLLFNEPNKFGFRAKWHRLLRRTREQAYDKVQELILPF